MQILATGAKGFLLSNILKHFNYEFSDTPDVIFQFGSPIDGLSTNNQIKLDLALAQTQKFCENARQTTHIIFASSEGLNDFQDYSNDPYYYDTKIAQERLIFQNFWRATILRIPRVYDPSREDGLMQRIREGNIDDSNKIIKYITLDEFINWFFECLYKTRNDTYFRETFTYKGKYHYDTIRGISNWICQS